MAIKRTTRGSAMIELIVALVSIVALFAGLVQMVSISRARHDTQYEARSEAGEDSLSDLTALFSDAEFIATRQLSTLDVCRILHIPPWMLAAQTGDSLTYSTVAEQASAFVRFSLAPWLRLIEEGLSADADLFPAPGHYCRFVLEGLLRADPAARAAFYKAALDPNTGWMTRAEVRVPEDLPAEEGA